MRAMGIAVVVACACGRIAFDPSTGASDAGPGTAQALLDAPPGSTAVLVGECSGAQISGVTKDTFLDVDRPDENFGARDEMRVGNPAERIALLRFDLSAIPPSAAVVSAQLVIWVSPTSGLEVGSLDIVALLEPWVEGTGDYTAGIANWTQRMAGTAWALPGAGAPLSRGTVVLGSFVPAVTSTRHVVTLDVGAVQGWVTISGSNHGMALVGVDTAAQRGWLSTSNASEPDIRPCMQVIYAP